MGKRQTDRQIDRERERERERSYIRNNRWGCVINSPCANKRDKGDESGPSERERERERKKNEKREREREPNSFGGSEQ